MRAPSFWWRDAGVRAHLLAPIAWLWGVAVRRRLRRGPAVDPGIPVICVGNLTVGGSGKTPTVAAITQHLEARGRHVHVLLRGYGGRLAGPHRVDPMHDTVDDVGDEALIHAARAPTWIARDRAAGAEAAAAAGAEVIVMDDGFQNPSLRKTLSIVVVDAARGFGNGRLVPAGPLREPVADGLARAEACLVIGRPHARAARRGSLDLPAGVALLEAELAPLPTGFPLDGTPVVAFAGIGHPEKFFETVRELGAEIVQAEGFPDHHRYTDRILARLHRAAQRQGAMLVTTEKDALRLPARFRREVMVLGVSLEPADPGAFAELVESVF